MPKRSENPASNAESYVADVVKSVRDAPDLTAEQKAELARITDRDEQEEALERFTAENREAQ